METTTKLNTIIKEHVSGDYYRCEFLGLKLIINIRFDYFNATTLCKSAGKDFNVWVKLKTSINLTNFIHLSKYKNYKLMFTIDGNGWPDLGGTYVVRELLLNIVSWAYPEYYLKFNNIMISKAREKMLGNTSEYKTINDKLDKILFQLEFKTGIINDNIDNTVINDKLDRILFQLVRPKNKSQNKINTG